MYVNKSSLTLKNMFDKLNVFALIISFCIGILYVYISSPTPNIVVKFPSPYNAGKILYKNNSNECYKYQYDKVNCDTAKNIKPQPIMENFNS